METAKLIRIFEIEISQKCITAQYKTMQDSKKVGTSRDIMQN